MTHRSTLLFVPLLTGLALATSAAAAEPPAPLGFAEARMLYHERADILRAHDAEVARAQHAADAARLLGGPKVDVAAMQVEGSKTLDLTLSTPPALGAMGLSSIHLGTKLDIGGPRAMVNLTWPLYTGGAVSAKQEALGHKVTETSAVRDEELNTMDAELAGKYWGVQLARSIERLRCDMLADEEKALARALRFEKEGLLSRIERMSVEVSRDAARRALVAAQTDARVAEAELARALRVETLPELTTPLFVLTGSLGTLDEWTAQARAASPVLARIGAQSAQARAGVAAAESAFKPQIFAFGSKSLITHYQTIVEPDWIAGIGIKFTLWSNTDRFASLSAAKSVVDKTEAARAEAENQVAAAVETAFLRVTQSRDEYRLTDSTVKLATENLRLREASFAEGLSTALDVSNARTQLAAAEIARRVAAYKFVASWAMLHAASGRMPAFVDSLNRSDLSPEN